MNLSFLRRWLIGSIAAGLVFLVSNGARFSSFYAATMIVLIIGLMNAALPYFISMMTFVSSMLTLGLMTLVANTLVLYMLAETRVGVAFASFDALFMIAVMISTLAWFATMATDIPLSKSKNANPYAFVQRTHR